MLCPNCGYENKEDAAACNLCGAVLRRTDSSVSTGRRTPSASNANGIFPDPSAFSTDPNAPPAPSFLASYDAQQEESARKAKYWLVGGAALVLVAAVALVISRLPYSPSTVDAMYDAYAAQHPHSVFPNFFTEYQGHRPETADYIFQFVHAYEQAFVDRDPYAEIDDTTQQRLAAVQSGKEDPGFSGAPTFTERDDKTINRINDVETVTRHLYGAGSKPFDTLRSLAGGDERGRERRQLQMELISGKKETQIQGIHRDLDNRVNHYRKLEQKTRDELQYFILNGNPKLRSIAQRLQDRFFSQGAGS